MEPERHGNGDGKSGALHEAVDVSHVVEHDHDAEKGEQDDTHDRGRRGFTHHPRKQFREGAGAVVLALPELIRGAHTHDYVEDDAEGIDLRHLEVVANEHGQQSFEDDADGNDVRLHFGEQVHENLLELNGKVGQGSIVLSSFFAGERLKKQATAKTMKSRVSTLG